MERERTRADGVVLEEVGATVKAEQLATYEKDWRKSSGDIR